MSLLSHETRIDKIDLGSFAEEHFDSLQLTVDGSSFQRGEVAKGMPIDRGTGLQQELHDSYMAILRCHA